MNHLTRVLPWLAFAVFASACSSSSMRMEQTFEDTDRVAKTYQNVLVIAVAGNYNSRSRFEREMTRRLNAGTTKATEYYVVADGDQELTRQKILNAIEVNGYDGVVVTRLGDTESEVTVKSGSSKAKITRRDESAVDFFRYDYEILNEPTEINIGMEVILITDFFDVEGTKRVWSANSIVSDKDHISYLLDDTVGMIVARLQRDGLVSAGP